MYPFSAHSFGPISMKLGMDTWNPTSDMGYVRLRFAEGHIEFKG